MHSTRRRDRTRWPVRALAIALIAASLLGCRDPYTRPRYRGAGATTPQHGGTFRFALESDVRSLDPHLGYDEYSTTGIHLLYDTLVDYAPDSTDLVPSLAERWEVSDDGRIYTFHLRAGVRFHNGRLLVADDVRRSFERVLDPQAIPSPGASFFHLIDGFDAFQEHRAPHLAGIVVLDASTVQFRLTQADQTFLNVMAMPFAAPIPHEIVEAEGRDGFSQHPVGTGPFMLERWESGSRLLFRRFPQYWRSAPPYVDRIVMEIGLARHLQFMRFQRGDLDHIMTTSILTADHVWLHDQPAWRPYIIDAPDISMYGISMNTERAPWTNVHIRRALAFALDRNAICRSRNYRIRPLGGLYPPGLPGYDPHLPGEQTYDPQRAHQEMALAGYPRGLPDEYDFWVSEGEAGLFYGQLIQADLARIGIRIRLHQASFAVYLENIERRGAVHLSLAGWSQDFPDPSNFIDTLLHSRNIQAEYSQNQAFYSNPTLDALLDRAHIERDRTRRIAMYQQAERIVVADAPWAFLYFPVKTEVNQPYVHGYVSHPVWTHNFRPIWLDLPRQRVAARDPGHRAAWSGLSALALPWSAW